MTGMKYSGRPVDLSRKVLFLDLNPDDRVHFPEQMEAQWSIHRVYDPEIAQEILESSPCPVGLVQLDNLTAKLYEQIQQLVNDTPHTNWIALLHQSSLEHPTIRRLVHDFFYDYHSLPLPEVENLCRLESTLGHAYGIELLDTPLVSKDHHELECQMVRSEEHTSELQSHHDLVCRLLLEKKKTIIDTKGLEAREEALSSWRCAAMARA